MLSNVDPGYIIRLHVSADCGESGPSSPGLLDGLNAVDRRPETLKQLERGVIVRCVIAAGRGLDGYSELGLPERLKVYVKSLRSNY